MRRLFGRDIKAVHTKALDQVLRFPYMFDTTRWGRQRGQLLDALFGLINHPGRL